MRSQSLIEKRNRDWFDDALYVGMCLADPLFLNSNCERAIQNHSHLKSQNSKSPLCM